MTSSTSSTGGFRSRSRKKTADKPPTQPPTSAESTGTARRSHATAGTSRRHAVTRYTPGADPRDLVTIDLARAISFDVIYRVTVEGAYANLALPQALRDYRIKRRDAAFATEITYGTLRTQGNLDAVIAAASSRPLSEIDPLVLTALRMGAYQLLYTRVEPHAAVDSSVNIVTAVGLDKATGFANAVLRTISRTPPQRWFHKLEPSGEIAARAFRNAHPEWIAESFAKVLGIGELEEALAADSERPIVHLVARPGEITAEELAVITEGEVGTYSPYAVYLNSGAPGKLEPVRDGLASVQDEGSQLIARAVTEAPVRGDDTGRWLDLCAGPGGKTALMGALAVIDHATVDAVEIQPHRGELVKKTTSGLPVNVHVADGRHPDLDGGYDRVLVDAPCSGLGALRRRPEARWRKQESDIPNLVALQKELLSSAIDLTRSGGVVVYSTCSPDLRETREVVDYILEHADVEELDAKQLVPNMTNTGEGPSVQMWPHRHGTDAMFFAVLRKN